MTRAVVFLAAAMVAASLGVVAQDTSNQRQNSIPNNTDNHPQQTVTVANPQSNTERGPSAAASNNQDSTKSVTARDSADSQTAQSDVNTETNNGQLPQTSTILPLLGLIGLGSLVAGFFARH